MIKNLYKDDYSFQQRITNKGRLVNDLHYIGDYYVLPFDKKEKRKTTLLNFVYIFFIISFMLIAGLLNADSSRTAWIVFPYIIQYLPIGYMIGGAITYITIPCRIQKIKYETSIERMRRSAIGILIFSIVNLILDTIFIFVHINNINLLKEIIYLFSFVMIIVIVFFYRKYYNRVYSNLSIEMNNTETI